MAIKWQNEPPLPTDFAGIRLLRVPAKSFLRGIITSDKLVGAPTHYANRRTQPCQDKDCELCRDGNQPRWHGYISLIHTASNNHIVLELTALAAVPIKDWETRHGSLRGANIRAERPGNRDNSPVQCRLEAADHDLRVLPLGVHLVTFLEHLWSPGTRPPAPTGRQAGHPEPPPEPNIRNTLRRNHPEQLPHPAESLGEPILDHAPPIQEDRTRFANVMKELALHGPNGNAAKDGAR